MRQKDPPLAVTLMPSRRLRAMMLAGHGLALVACAAAPLPWPYQAALAAAIVGHHRHVASNRQQAPLTIRYHQTLGWRLSTNGQLWRVKILPTTFISRHLLSLQLEILQKSPILPGTAKNPGPGKRLALLVMTDSLSADDYRRLQVKLKTSWHNTAKPARTQNITP